MKKIHERLKEKGYPKVLEGPIDIRAHGLTVEYVDLLQRRIEELEAGNKELKAEDLRLKDALDGVQKYADDITHYGTSLSEFIQKALRGGG